MFSGLPILRAVQAAAAVAVAVRIPVPVPEAQAPSPLVLPARDLLPLFADFDKLISAT